MKTRQWARFPRSASPGEVSPTVEESLSSPSPRGSHASRCVSGCAARRVARDGSLQEACLPGGRCTRAGAKCAWKRHAWRFPRSASHGEVSPPVEQSVSSPCPRSFSVRPRRQKRLSRRVAPAPGPPTRQPRWGGRGGRKTIGAIRRDACEVGTVIEDNEERRTKKE